MNMVTTLRLRSLCVSSLVAFAACSGTSSNSANGLSTDYPIADHASPAATDAAAPVVSTVSAQDPQDPAKVDRAGLVAQALTNARRSMELRLFEDARNEAAFALELDETNAEARDILRRANEVLGDSVSTVGNKFQDIVLRERIAAERERTVVNQELELGKAHMDQGQFGRAIERFERALAIVNYSQHFKPDDALRLKAEKMYKDATRAKTLADVESEQRAKAASESELKRMDDEQNVARELRVARLLEDANVKFQNGAYADAVERVDQALLLDPTNPTGLALRDLADRARSTTAIEQHRERFRQEWNKTFLDLQQSDVPQTEVVKFDPTRWAEVSQRRPNSYTPAEDLESPENRAIQKKLDEAVLEHNFASADVDAWAAYYATVTGVTIFVTPEVKSGMDSANTTLTDFKLPRMSVTNALKVIQTQTGVAYKIRDGIVHLVSPENAVGAMYLKPYQVSDLVQGVRGRPGPDLKLTAPGSDEGLFGGEEEDPAPSVVDDGRLRELIQNTVATGKWDGQPFTINYQAGVLFVNADTDTHEKVGKLLKDLRRHVGIQIDVESRFLRVEDSFLEDVGVDLRGLGNQAANGVPGRGLETRPNAGFDDFGQGQLLNPADPGSIGTGTEPGFFFDDGGDGDYMGRVENLYDQTLGSRYGGPDNQGGLSMQYTFLNDAELEIILRAVQKEERGEEIDAPRLLIYNNTRASMSVLRQISYIQDFEVEIAQAAAVANPRVGQVSDGVALDVRPVVDSDLRFITMELRPTLMTLQLPIPTFTTTLGVGQPISIQLPKVTLQRVRTTVTMPDGGTMMLGGMKIMERESMESGVPILSDIPLVSFFFSRKGTSVLNRKVLILISAKIILMDEHEPEAMALPDGTILTSK